MIAGDPDRKPVPAGVLNRASLTQKESTDVLKELCSNKKPELYEALSNFILLDPRKQAPKLGTIPEEWEKGSTAMSQGNKLVARVSYEIAVRLGFFKRDKASVKKSLEQANQVSEDQNSKRLHGILLSNLDEAMKISDEYYKLVYSQAEDENPSAA